MPIIRASALATVLILALTLRLGLNAGAPPALAQAKVDSLAIALTFDDLPFAAASQPYFPAAQVKTKELLAVLRKHRAPAIGFVNEGQLDAGGPRRDERELVLRQWIDADMTLGNHTYSHRDFNSLTVDEFKNEIIRGEPTLSRLTSLRSLRTKLEGLPFFRHPMTHTGNTKQKKEAIEAFLVERGYRIAPHTVENSDFIFNAVYVRALAGKDRALAERVRDAYVDLTMAAMMFAESASRTLFGRGIPQTLLLHANTLNADVLDTLLSRFEGRGYRFIALDDAMADAAYATPDTMVTASGPTWIWRWATTLKVRLNGKEDPEVPAWVMEAYRR